MPEGTSQVSRSTAIALAVGGLVVGAIAGGVIVDTLFGGNEAPIRVKNTSIDLRLLGPDHRWQRLGTDRYSVQGPPKGRSDYYIEIEGTNCTVSEYGATVALEHSNGSDGGRRGQPHARHSLGECGAHHLARSKVPHVLRREWIPQGRAGEWHREVPFQRRRRPVLHGVGRQLAAGIHGGHPDVS
jgi:hypothetical protein